MLLSENYLSSVGFETRKETFGCLVKYLEKHGVADEYFNDAKTYKISTQNCSDVVSRTKQNITTELSSRLNFCDEHYDSETESLISTKVSKLNKMQKTKLTGCHKCMTGIMEKVDYVMIRLHAAAVNVTIVNLKVWKYFTISSSVKELINQSDTLEKKYLEKCKRHDYCEDSINFCK